MRSIDLNISILLVWLSLIMLAAFLLYWNINQYHQEKKELRQDLTDQMSLAYSEFNDSLFTSIISMISMDTILGDFHIQTQFKGANPKALSIEGLSKLDTNISISINSTSGFFSEMDSVSVLASSDVYRSSSQMPRHDSSGVFISRSSSREDVGDQKDWNVVMKQLSGHADESENIMLHFVENLHDQGLPSDFEVDILMLDTLLERGNLNIPFKGLNDTSKQKQAVFKNYNLYLMTKILPSILMSSFLFGFMSLAFFFIERARRSQEELIDMKTEFISNMTHELKTPISTVGVAIESLSEFGAMSDPIKRKEYFDITKHELNRLNILIDKVMKMSSFDSGEVSLEYEKIDLRLLLEKMLKSMSLHFDKHNVDLQYNAEGHHFFIKGDPIHLTNVLYNLFDNAIKYSSNQPSISINLIEDDTNIQLSILDKGIGIPKEYQKQIFDRFFRVPTQDVHNVKGYGIGLNYVHGVIKEHQATIDVVSKEDKGTAFTIKLAKIK